MPFFRPLSQTAPGYDESSPWPIHGLAYVVSFAGPVGGGLVAGVRTMTWSGALVGLIVGATITLAHGWLGDTYIDRWVAKFQSYLNRPLPRTLLNILAFSWVIGLTAVSMVTTWAILARLDIFPTP